MTTRTETLREIDALQAELGARRVYLAEHDLGDWLAKIRAHVEADERKRLQGEMLADELGDDAAELRLDLSADWRLAPQRARDRARAMPPVRGERTGTGERVEPKGEEG